MGNWLNSERNGQKPAERFNINEKELRDRDKIARNEYENRKKEGVQRSIETGRQSQKAEAYRIGGKALRAAIMGLLASFIKDVIRKLILWIRSGARKFSTFINYVKDAIKCFLTNLKEHIKCRRIIYNIYCNRNIRPCHRHPKKSLYTHKTGL